MSEKLTLKIAVLIGSNGKWAVNPLEDADWGMMADCIMDWPEKGRPVDPDAVVKYIIEAEVTVPPKSPPAIQATSVVEAAA